MYLVAAALEAGKHVYCERPLGTSLDKAAEIVELAHGRDVVAAVGLQARVASTINRLRDLVADGYVGRVVATRTRRRA